jgi:hypothetical protein
VLAGGQPFGQTVITRINRIQLVFLVMQNKTLVPLLAAIHRIFTPVMCEMLQGRARWRCCTYWRRSRALGASTRSEGRCGLPGWSFAAIVGVAQPPYFARSS